MPRKAMESLTESMFYVLMAFQEGKMCGTDIADCIDTLTEGRLQIGPATLYTILAKFVKEKYIREVVVEGRKRTYEMTQMGKKAYEAELIRLRQCVADAERIREEGIRDGTQKG